MQDTVNKDRERYIGGSDIPIIMNLSPFKTRFDLLLEKSGYKANDFEGNNYTEYGNRLEPKIRDFFNNVFDKDGADFIEGKHVREANEIDEPIGVRIHTDGERITNYKGSEVVEVLEIKTTSQVKETLDEYKIYLVQLLFYMVMVGAPIGTLAVYYRPEDFNEEFDPSRLQIFIAKVEDYKDLIDEIKRAVELFIEDLEKVKENPFITEEELLPQEIPDIATRILAFESQLETMKKIEKQIKEDKARLKEAMEAANVKTWNTPNGYKITLVEDTPSVYKEVETLDEEAFKLAHPKLHKKYLKTELKEIKGKSGYVKITAPKSKEG